LSKGEHKNPDDYLELIYVISEEGHKRTVRTKDISERLGVYPSTVTEMIQKLAERGLVIWMSYGGVRLTEEGRKYARAILKRHRILECESSKRSLWNRTPPEWRDPRATLRKTRETKTMPPWKADTDHGGMTSCWRSCWRLFVN
jgi:predicted DNA-binding transcriptional regulator YafY